VAGSAVSCFSPEAVSQGIAVSRCKDWSGAGRASASSRIPNMVRLKPAVSSGPRPWDEGAVRMGFGTQPVDGHPDFLTNPFRSKIWPLKHSTGYSFILVPSYFHSTTTPSYGCRFNFQLEFTSGRASAPPGVILFAEWRGTDANTVTTVGCAQ